MSDELDAIIDRHSEPTPQPASADDLKAIIDYFDKHVIEAILLPARRKPEDFGPSPLRKHYAEWIRKNPKPE